MPVPRSVLSRTPRKPMTAYNVFYKIAYAELSAMHPEATLSQLSQMCSDRWKSLSENEKRPYYDDASTDRARYRQELLDYQNGTRWRTLLGTKPPFTHTQWLPSAPDVRLRIPPPRQQLRQLITATLAPPQSLRMTSLPELDHLGDCGRHQ